MEASLGTGGKKKKEIMDALLILFFSLTWGFSFCLQHINDLSWSIKWRIMKSIAASVISANNSAFLGEDLNLLGTHPENNKKKLYVDKYQTINME